jgi:2,5-diamino-6-(ribosylamino)-4(3H)-pyrimidinone 5'-phosphate reductase
MKRPHIICHMASSVDGKIDGDSLRALLGNEEYETTGEQLNGDAWICGRTTMERHFAEKEPFVSASNRPVGPQPVFVARKADSYAISVDTHGRLRWPGGDLDGDHLICVVSEQASEDYLGYLRENGISYVVAGPSAVDLPNAMDQLGEHFGIRTLLLEGGGHINGGFLEADLVDELSLLIIPGIDGRHEIPAVFDGLGPARNKAVPLELKSVDQREGGILWVRYEVVRQKGTS